MQPKRNDEKIPSFLDFFRKYFHSEKEFKSFQKYFHFSLRKLMGLDILFFFFFPSLTRNTCFVSKLAEKIFISPFPEIKSTRTHTYAEGMYILYMWIHLTDYYKLHEIFQVFLSFRIQNRAHDRKTKNMFVLYSPGSGNNSLYFWP